MDACSDCGSELIGAKKYCVVCGAPAGDTSAGKKKEKGPKKEKEVVHYCYICEEEADRVRQALSIRALGELLWYNAADAAATAKLFHILYDPIT